MPDARDPIEHTPDCFWNRAEPSIDGDEGACCTCGAYEEKQVEWLRRNRPEALHDRLTHATVRQPERTAS